MQIIVPNFVLYLNT